MEAEYLKRKGMIGEEGKRRSIEGGVGYSIEIIDYVEERKLLY